MFCDDLANVGHIWRTPIMVSLRSHTHRNGAYRGQPKNKIIEDPDLSDWIHCRHTNTMRTWHGDKASVLYILHLSVTVVHLVTCAFRWQHLLWSECLCDWNNTHGNIANASSCFFSPGVRAVNKLLCDGAGQHGVSSGALQRPEGGKNFRETAL